MAWTLEFRRSALRELDALDRPVAQRILRFLNDRVLKLENPRMIGEALRGPKLGAFWKYRVGDYRIIAAIEDSRLVVLVVRVASRGEVYER